MRVSDKPITDVSQIDEQAPRLRRVYTSLLVVVAVLLIAGVVALVGAGLQEVGYSAPPR